MFVQRTERIPVIAMVRCVVGNKPCYVTVHRDTKKIQNVEWKFSVSTEGGGSKIGTLDNDNDGEFTKASAMFFSDRTEFIEGTPFIHPLKMQYILY